MDWGKGIALFFGAFVLFMISLVVICVKQDDIHLVTPNYYEEEVKYQEKIDKMANAKDLGYEVLDYNAKAKVVALKLPQGAVGTLHLFRPSDARLDKKYAVKMELKEGVSFNLSDLKPGYWKMMLTWKEGEKEFYLEQKISI